MVERAETEVVKYVSISNLQSHEERIVRSELEDGERKEEMERKETIHTQKYDHSVKSRSADCSLSRDSR
jgi:hypothetical protein